MRRSIGWLVWLAACGKDPVDTDLGIEDSPSEEPPDARDTDVEEETEESEETEPEDTDLPPDTDVPDPPAPEVPRRLKTRRWKQVFGDEFNGPVAGDPCYDPAVTTPLCLYAYGTTSACEGADKLAIQGLNYCVWATYEMYNWMDWGKPLGYGINKLDPELVSVHDGKLWLNAARVPGDGVYDCGNPDEVWRTDDCPIHSGAVMSMPFGGHSGFEQKYGRFEVRAKLPRGGGAWPAHWMLPTGLPWPEAGEIDIMEAVAHEPTVTTGNFHSGRYESGTRTHHSVGTRHDLHDERLYDEYHTFAAEWDEDQIRFFLDDLEFGHLSAGWMVPGDVLSSPGGAMDGSSVAPFPLWIPDSPFYFILNTSVVPTDYGSRFSVETFAGLIHEIDWVHAYVACSEDDPDPACETRGTGSADITQHSGMDHGLWPATKRLVHPGDFNGDGVQDALVRARTATESTLLLLGDGRGGFYDAQYVDSCCFLDMASWSDASHAATVGDFDGDGADDVFLQARSATTNSYLVLGKMEGGFANARSVTNDASLNGTSWSAGSRTAHAGDFDGDGADDLLLVGNSSSYDTYVVYSNGTDGFRSSTAITTRGGLSGSRWAENELVVADFDGNGSDDVLLRGAHLSAVTSLLLAKDGAFTVSGVSYSFGMFPELWDASASRSHVGDFDGDGKADLLLQADASGDGSWMLRGAAAGFSSAQSIISEGSLNSSRWSAEQHDLVVGDFDGDGASDVLLRPSGPTGDALYLRADRTGGFEPAVDITKEVSFNAQHWSAAYHEAYSADWDGDGRDEPLLRALTEDDRTYLVYLPVE